MIPNRPLPYLLLLLTASTPQAPSQTPPPNWTFLDLQSTLTELTVRTSDSSPEAPYIANMLQSLDTLQKAYLAAYGPAADTEPQIAQHFDNEFSQSITDDFTLLKHLPAAPPDKLTTLTNISRDLNVKAQSIHARLGLAGESFPSIIDIDLTVSIADRSPVHPATLSIRFNSCGRGQTPPSHVLLNGAGKLKTKLPPGCFLIWAQDGETIIAKKQQDIGLSATKPEKIDFSF